MSCSGFSRVPVASTTFPTRRRSAAIRDRPPCDAAYSYLLTALSAKDITEERGRKGRTKLMYHFGYAFEADGQQYVGQFTTSESNAEPYAQDHATIDIAYAKADPSRFDRLSRLQSQSGFGGLLMRLLVAVAGAALVAFLMHMLVVAKLIVPRMPEADAAPAA